MVGIDSAQIVRRVPRPARSMPRRAFLAHVEFDRPELPWLFTPLEPTNDRLQPWLVLVVCDASVTQLEPGPPGFPQRCAPTRRAAAARRLLGVAHAQVAGPRDTAASRQRPWRRLSEGYGPTNLSRIVCPRKLDPHRSWIACLVPTFDCGVRRDWGRRRHAGSRVDARTERQRRGSEIVLPVYDRGLLHGRAGDFESLAKRLKPVVAPWNIGRRIVDASRPAR